MNVKVEMSNGFSKWTFVTKHEGTEADTTRIEQETMLFLQTAISSLL